MREPLLFMDLETGGVDENETDLLSIALAAFVNGNITATIELFIKKKVYRVTESALKINKIDLVKHHNDPKAIWEGDLFKIIEDFIATYIYGWTADERIRSKMPPVKLAGHRVHFDVRFLQALYKRKGWFFPAHFKHNTVDTAIMLENLYDYGILEQNISGSEDAFNYFGIKIDNRHSALGDIVGTVELYVAVGNLLKQLTGRL
jgi:DNA polymerase III epsilon subunit-like protein